jgi:WhiB family redox-sensing transcriptional regulator
LTFLLSFVVRAFLSVEGNDMDAQPVVALLIAVFEWEQAEWIEQARCRGVDPELFFPARGASTTESKAICAQCPVAAECLEYSLKHGEKFGIWGAKSERERREIRKQRKVGRYYDWNHSARPPASA